MNSLEVIKSFGVIPVLGLKNPNTAAQLAKSLIDGGLPLVEVTLRDSHAIECLHIIKETYPDMLVGAGTVLSTEMVLEAKEAGADFIVTPGLNPKVVAYTQDIGIPIVPGCVTATEIEAGLSFNLNTFKFFPAESINGLATIKQLCGPYRNISFIPTSGITFDNISEYLAYDYVAAVGGSFMAPAAMIEAEEWEKIASRCKQAVRASLGFELAHIGINCDSPDEGVHTATWFAEHLDLPVKIGEKSSFAGNIIECCNMQFPGENGHIAIYTLSPERAVAFFKAHSIPLREEFKKTKEGKLISVYLEEEINGFAVHILKKNNI